MKDADYSRFTKKLQNNPVFHIEQIQGCKTLTEYQKEICAAVLKYERVSIAACHDIGKSFIMAKLVLWFFSSFKGSKVITTAPTSNQVEKILWSEIRTGYEKSKYPLGGRMLNTEWKADTDWFAFGFSPRKEAGTDNSQGTASSGQGFHAPYILVILDEATGIPKQIWDQLEGAMTSGFVRLVAIGNPTSKACEFYRCFTYPGYKKIYLSCFNSPNLIANKIHSVEDIQKELDKIKLLPGPGGTEYISKYKKVHPMLLTTQWVIDKAIRWGLKHPLFVSKVLGKFPDEDANVQIPLGLVEIAQARHLEAVPNENVITRSIGVDPARFGPDSTVITMLEDNIQALRKSMPKTRTTEITGQIIAIINSVMRVKNEVVLVDGTGLGGGVIDELREAQGSGIIPKTIMIIEINFGAACTEPNDAKHFSNIKAKMFDQLSKDMRDNLALLPEDKYLEQLPTILYKFNSKGQLIIESKEDYKKRTGLGSPDDADSLAIANLGRYAIAQGNISCENRGIETIAGNIGGDSW